MERRSDKSFQADHNRLRRRCVRVDHDIGVARISFMLIVTAIVGMATVFAPADAMLCTTMESLPSVTTRVNDSRNSSSEMRFQRVLGGSSPRPRS